MAKNPYDQSSFDMELAANSQGHVDCLGMTFEKR